MLNYQDYANWSAYGKSLGPIFELSKIGNAMTEELTRENLSLWSDNMSAWVKYLQTMNKMERPDSAFKSNMGFLTEISANNLQYMENGLKICGRAMREVSDRMQDRMEAYSEQQDSKTKK